MLTFFSDSDLQYQKDLYEGQDFVKLTDKDLDEISWFGNAVRNHPLQRTTVPVLAEDWKNYTDWIREKYRQQFEKELESSHRVYFEHNDEKFKFEWSD